MRKTFGTGEGGGEDKAEGLLYNVDLVWGKAGPPQRAWTASTYSRHVSLVEAGNGVKLLRLPTSDPQPDKPVRVSTDRVSTDVSHRPKFFFKSPRRNPSTRRSWTALRGPSKSAYIRRSIHKVWSSCYRNRCSLPIRT